MGSEADRRRRRGWIIHPGRDGEAARRSRAMTPHRLIVRILMLSFVIALAMLAVIAGCASAPKGEKYNALKRDSDAYAARLGQGQNAGDGTGLQAMVPRGMRVENGQMVPAAVAPPADQDELW